MSILSAIGDAGNAIVETVVGSGADAVKKTGEELLREQLQEQLSGLEVGSTEWIAIAQQLYPDGNYPDEIAKILAAQAQETATPVARESDEDVSAKETSEETGKEKNSEPEKPNWFLEQYESMKERCKKNKMACEIGGVGFLVFGTLAAIFFSGSRDK